MLREILYRSNLSPDILKIELCKCSGKKKNKLPQTVTSNEFNDGLKFAVLKM